MDKAVRNLNSGWKFHYGECEGAWYKGFDDSSFREVLLPHDWSVEHPFSEKYSSGTGYLAGGTGWYRLHFQIPEEYREKRILVAFEGVYKNSQVWCNSYYLGKHPSGYTGFSYDISQLAEFGARENTVSVRVSHPDLADSRWFTGSGIIRGVSLIAEERMHPAENGICLITKKLEGTGAVLEIHHEVVNDTDSRQDIRIETELAAADGTAVLKISEAASIPAGCERTYTWQAGLAEPVLWSTEHPHLYRMRSYYCTADGGRFLVDEQLTGIRTIRFDAAHGFFLNEKPMKIKGVCVHHDAGCLGAAVTPEIWERRLAALKECSCNAIRCSHNPHMPGLYALCDKMGFLMMDEAFDEWENAKNKWSAGHNVYPPKHQGYAEDFPEWHERDLRAMVRRDRCHPSVILWSIGNEIDYPNDPYCHPSFLAMTGNNDADKPAAERRYDPDKPNAKRLVVIAQELSAIVRSEDDSRPVTMALAYPELSVSLGVLAALDVAGYNYKEHLYEADHLAYPDMPFLGSENAHSLEAWKAVTDQEYISGQFLWTGIDYLGEASGWPVHGSPAGLLDCAGFKKPEFYRRASFWKKEPVLALSAEPEDQHCQKKAAGTFSWNFEPGQIIHVRCYSNLAKIRLFLNGKEVGMQKESDRQVQSNTDGAYHFRIIYEPGKLAAKGFDAQGKERAAAVLQTSQKAENLSVQPWRSLGEEEHETGYIYQYEVCLLDGEKNLAADDRLIRVEVEGSGRLAGMENGDLSDITPYCLNERMTRAGRLMVYVKRTAKGRICVRFRMGQKCVLQMEEHVKR